MRQDNAERKQIGTLQMITGGIRRAFGRIFGQPDTELRGRAEQLQGRANLERGKAGERIEGTMQAAGGAVKRTVGDVLGDHGMQVRGAAGELEGTARRDLNR